MIDWLRDFSKLVNRTKHLFDLREIVEQSSG